MNGMNTAWMAMGLACAVRAAALDLYVAPGGDDNNPGTRAAPLATPAGARDAVRRSGLPGREPMTVHFADGVYELPAPLVFAPEDSGTAEAPVTYRAVNEGGAIFSGGQRLTLDWQPHRDGIWRAATPEGLEMDQLFADGVARPMARYPNRDLSKPDVPYHGFAADAISPERAARWADPAGGYIHAMHAARWGGYHYRITGKNPDGSPAYEGGWQNNRQMGMHGQHRMVENIIEELDAPEEWFHDADDRTLYFMPPEGMDVRTARIEVVRLRSLVEFRGARETPVRHITLRGLTFRHAARTFMDTREPLTRSDWTLYRGGAVFFEGAEDCAVEQAVFDQVGGNAVFINAYNRRVAVRECWIHEAGASGVVFAGDPKAVRQPLFEHGQRMEYANLDRTPGPQTEDYPADGLVEDCLIVRTGRVEKQSAGVQISMARRITVRHCTIHDVPRAGINVSEGAWGGHLIEGCDVFDTVRETDDHGSFNSWGRDRFWQLHGAPAEELPDLALLDAVEPTIIRHSRWRCDHGWDVDLDDGSSNYEIYNNVFLKGGLKLREGFHRRAWNNIAVNNGLHPHVWYPNSGDEVTRNIFMRGHQPAGGMPGGRWGKEINRNLFVSEADRTRFAGHGCDANSLAGDPMFIDPDRGDYRVHGESPALKLGFVNFSMDEFGVRTPALKAKAGAPELPAVARAAGADGDPDGGVSHWQGAVVRGLRGVEFSAYGIGREDGGVVLVRVPAGGLLDTAGLKAEDVILGLGDTATRTADDLRKATDAARGGAARVVYVRGQQRSETRLPRMAWVEARAAAPAEAAARLADAKADERPVRVTSRPDTHNEPLATLHDGRLASTYGPVFANGVPVGLYKADLGKPRAVREVRTWSFAMNGNRGAQRFTLYGSASETDPGWTVHDDARFMPLAEVDAACAGSFLETIVRGGGEAGLGTYRWLVWAARPVTGLGEHTAFQEMAISVMDE
jgi:hypothetical protein